MRSFTLALCFLICCLLCMQLFRDDIKYLLSMETLWKKRRPPNPLDFDNLPHTGTCLHLSFNLFTLSPMPQYFWMFFETFFVSVEYKKNIVLWTLKLTLFIIKDCVKHSMCTNIHVCQCNVIQIEKILTYLLLQCRLPINVINRNLL